MTVYRWPPKERGPGSRRWPCPSNLVTGLGPGHLFILLANAVPGGSSVNSLVAEEGKHTGYPECPRHPSFEVSRELALTLTAQGDPAAHPGARLASRVQGACSWLSPLDVVRGRKLPCQAVSCT